MSCCLDLFTQSVFLTFSVFHGPSSEISRGPSVCQTVSSEVASSTASEPFTGRRSSVPGWHQLSPRRVCDYLTHAELYYTLSLGVTKRFDIIWSIWHPLQECRTLYMARSKLPSSCCRSQRRWLGRWKTALRAPWTGRCYYVYWRSLPRPAPGQVPSCVQRRRGYAEGRHWQVRLTFHLPLSLSRMHLKLIKL